MKRLGYISATAENVAMLRQLLGPRWEVVHCPPHDITVGPDFAAVIFELASCGQDIVELPEAIMAACRNAAVPFFICAAQNETVSFTTSLLDTIAGIIHRPFRRPQLDELLNTPEANVDDLTVFSLYHHFVNAVGKVLQVTGEITVERDTIYSLGKFDAFGDLSGSVRLSGALAGRAILSLYRDFAVELTGRIIGCDRAHVTGDDFTEAANEIANQVGGVIRTVLWNENRQFDISLPELIFNAESPPVATAPEQWFAAILRAENHLLKLQLALQVCRPEIVPAG